MSRWKAGIALGMTLTLGAMFAGCGAAEEATPEPTQDAAPDVIPTDVVEPDADASSADVTDSVEPSDLGPTDTATSPDGDGSAGLDTVGMTVCEAYCATVEVACVGDQAIDFGEDSCGSACAGWTEGDTTDTASNTASCRLYHATVALESPEQHCVYAAPDGGGVCTDDGQTVCEQYCTAMFENCGGSHAHDFGIEGCEAGCELWPVGEAGSMASWSAHCHLSHATLAAQDPTAHCADGSPGSLVCVDPEPECEIDDECLLGQTCVDGFCEGDALECEVDGDCEGEQICEDSTCVDPPEPECEADDDCEGDDVCTDGACVDYVPPPECLGDGDCAAGAICDGGSCVVVTYTAHVQPILANACAPCHTANNSGGTNFASVYMDTQESSSVCVGLTVGECAVVRIDNGSMPTGAGSPPGPEAMSVIEAWIDGEMPE